jgi:adenosylcobinamide-GDP ribazoletransferase
MTGFFVALKFLTRLPAPSAAPERASDIGAAAPWFPAVGALVGLLVALAVALGAGVSPWVGALLGLLAWVIVTGGLHLDGLGDVVDAIGAAHGNPERFLEVARDPHTGAFGVMAIVLLMAAKLILLATMAAAADADLASLAVALALVAAWARWGVLVIASMVPPLGDGLGKRLSSGVEARIVGVLGIALTIVSLFAAPILAAAIPLAIALAVYWRLRIGGVNGDAHGASIEILESLLLLLLVMV